MCSWPSHALAHLVVPACAPCVALPAPRCSRVLAVSWRVLRGVSSSVVGQFVSLSSTKAFGSSGPGFGYSKESRQVTIDNGKRLIQQLASQLHLTQVCALLASWACGSAAHAVCGWGQHYVDSAHRLFILAIQRNFIQGRKTIHVVAACLYIVCRREKSAHLLIDFAEALRVSCMPVMVV